MSSRAHKWDSRPASCLLDLTNVGRRLSLSWSASGTQSVSWSASGTQSLSDMFFQGAPAVENLSLEMATKFNIINVYD